jgi:hypothetical protein
LGNWEKEMNCKLVATVAVLSFAPIAAHAADVSSRGSAAFSSPAVDPWSGRFSIGPIISTLGVGAEVGYLFNRNVGVRANATFFSASRNQSFDDIDFRVKAELLSAGANVDWYPFGGAFRVSGGLRYNGNNAKISASPTGAVNVGNNVYTAAEVGTLSGKLSFPAVAPTLTIGVEGNPFGARSWTVSVDAGVMFQGAGKVRLSSTGVLANDPTFQADLSRETASIKRDLKRVQVFPVVSVAARYWF